MQEILAYIQEEVEQRERMVTRTNLIQKFSDKQQIAIQALNLYYEKANQKIDAIFTIIEESENGLISTLKYDYEINNKMNIKEISIHAIALKDQIVTEELFPPSMRGIAALKVSINEVNLSSLVQAMALESQKIVLNKKVESLDHKRKNDAYESTNQTNFSKQVKTIEQTLPKTQNQNCQEIVNQSQVQEEKVNSQAVSKKPKIVLKSKVQPSVVSQQQQEIQAHQEDMPKLQIVDEVINKNEPIIEEKPQEKVKVIEIQQHQKIAKAPAAKDIGAGSKKLDSFFKKK